MSVPPLEIFRFMALTRLIDERMWQLNRMGVTPKVVGSHGHEAIAVGVGLAITKGTDWVLPYYRDMGMCLVLGQSPLDQFLAVLGKAADPNSGGRQIHGLFSDRRFNIVTGSSPVGTQFPHAVGIALALRMRGEPGAVWVCGGDGSTSTGDWHEAMNFAAIHELPVVFVIENNGYAISVPLDQQMPVADVADRAPAYGMRGRTVDGTDVLAVVGAAAEARASATSGAGPYLLECRTHRLLPHTSDDDDRGYRSRAEVEASSRHDPLRRYATWLEEQGIATSARLAEVRAELARIVDDAVEGAKRSPDPSAEDLTRHVYADGAPPAYGSESARSTP